MDSENIFDTVPVEFLPAKPVSASAPASAYPLGNDTVSQGQSSITSKIANFMKKSTRSEGFSSYNQQEVAGIQSSALIFNVLPVSFLYFHSAINLIYSLILLTGLTPYES